MIVGLGDFADSVNKGQWFGKIGKIESFQEFIVNYFPVIKLAQSCQYFFRIKFFLLHSFAPRI